MKPPIRPATVSFDLKNFNKSSKTPNFFRRIIQMVKTSMTIPVPTASLIIALGPDTELERETIKCPPTFEAEKELIKPTKTLKRKLSFIKFTPLLILTLIFCFSNNVFATQRVRRVPVQGDQIVTVKTSIGIATIIQVPDRPNSVVVGDQDSFKVEYLDQAITIKPLTGGAKSNLYIYTDWKRFNVELVSGSEANADYVVYLEMPKDKPLATQTKDFGVRWTEFKNQLRNDNLNLNIKRVGRAKNGILLIEFNVSSTKKEAFKAEWIWLTQMGETQPIHNLFMSSLEVSPQKTISGVLQLREVDLNTNETFRIELRRNKVSYLTVQKVATWKR